MQVGDDNRPKAVTIVGSRGKTKRHGYQWSRNEERTNLIPHQGKVSIQDSTSMKSHELSRGYQLVILPRKYDLSISVWKVKEIYPPGPGSDIQPIHRNLDSQEKYPGVRKELVSIISPTAF